MIASLAGVAIANCLFGHATTTASFVAVMFFPLVGAVASFIAVSILAGSFRAVVMVGNTVGMVEDMGQTRFSRGVASGVFNAANDVGHILGPGFAGLVAASIGVKQTFFVAPLLIAAAFVATLLAFNLFLGRVRDSAGGGGR